MRWPHKNSDGNIRGISRACVTTVNLIRVADVAEEVVRSVREHTDRSTLRSDFSSQELQRRFGFKALVNLEGVLLRGGTSSGELEDHIF